MEDLWFAIRGYKPDCTIQQGHGCGRLSRYWQRLGFFNDSEMRRMLPPFSHHFGQQDVDSTLPPGQFAAINCPATQRINLLMRAFSSWRSEPNTALLSAH